MMQAYRFLILLFVFVLGGMFRPAVADDSEVSASQLAKHLEPWVDLVQLRSPAYVVEADICVPIDGKEQRIQARLERINEEAFSIRLAHVDFDLELVRTATSTALALPKHKKVFWGSGMVHEQDHLAPTNVFSRLVSSGTMLQVATNLLGTGSVEDIANMAIFSTKAKRIDAKNWDIGNQMSVSFVGPMQLEIHIGDCLSRVQVQRSSTVATSGTNDLNARGWVASRWPGMELIEMSREEMELTLARGVRRAGEVLAPSPRLTSPKEKDKSVANGQLIWVDGQRVALLAGTPEQIGKAHGELLRDESMRCIDSVLYAFGSVQTVMTGKWFRKELDLAYERLSPHIPERHKRETRALADSLGLDTRLVETVNVFPELFHCSGFAVFGSATAGGKLYHGRVLDYMTEIGLQDSATTFVVAPKDHHAFANVGYAGFIGSVSGMNAKQISLGEMGGKGEGQWDGVPMATLMRRALEECTTLDEVKQLWTTSPRTCEYYYVFADGKSRQAVGVAATPSSIEFIGSGESHPQLGDGIRDAVVLSAGDRLLALKKRVTDSHGKIDVPAAQNLMCRPVAMKSNLHNVLFVPEDGVLYVANASHTQPAAERPYVRLNLLELVERANAAVRAVAVK
jgi:hypothetical protein